LRFADLQCLRFFYNTLVDASLLVEVESYIRQQAIDAGKTGKTLEAAFHRPKVFSQALPFVVAVFFQLALAGLSSAAMIAAWHESASRGSRDMAS